MSLRTISNDRLKDGAKLDSIITTGDWASFLSNDGSYKAGTAIVGSLPTGGFAWQKLVKNTNANFDASWVNDSGWATWGSITGTLSSQTDLNTALSNKADLVAGKVPSSQLPSYVDDVETYANLASFPVTGETGKIYIALDSNKGYRWNGSAYTELFVSGGGDASTNTSTSVDWEIALFSGTGGKTIKRATTTGLLKASSGVIAQAVAGTDYVQAISAGTNIGITGSWTTASPYVISASGGSSFSGCSLFTTTPPTIYAANTWVTIPWNNERFDTSNYHDNTTNNPRITVASAWTYKISFSAFAQWNWFPTWWHDYYYARALLNWNTSVCQMNCRMTTATGVVQNVYPHLDFTIVMSANDYIEIQFYVERQASSINILSGSEFNRFDIIKLA